MTWGEFIAAVESKGIMWKDKIDYIDTTGMFTENFSINVFRSSIPGHYSITAGEEIFKEKQNET